MKFKISLTRLSNPEKDESRTLVWCDDRNVIVKALLRLGFQNNIHSQCMGFGACITSYTIVTWCASVCMRVHRESGNDKGGQRNPTDVIQDSMLMQTISLRSPFGPRTNVDYRVITLQKERFNTGYCRVKSSS